MKQKYYFYSKSKQEEFAALQGQYGNDTRAIINNFDWDIESLEALEVAYKTEYKPVCLPISEVRNTSWAL